MSDEWDVAGKIYVPAPIMRSLTESGMNRASLRITRDGFVLRPYKGAPSSQRTKQSVKLPFAS